MSIHMGVRARIATPLPRAVLALLIGVAAGRVDLLDGVSPVAVPLFLVDLGTDFLPPGVLGVGVLLGAMVGGLRSGVSVAFARVCAHGLGLLVAWALMRGRNPEGIRRMGLYGGISQAAGAWLMPALIHLPERPPVVAWAAAAIEVVLAALTATLIQSAGDAAIEGRERFVPLLAPGVLLALGLQGVSLPLLGLRLDYLTAAAVTLIGAVLDSAAGGAIAGSAMGLTLLMSYHIPAGGPAFASMAAAGTAFAAGGLAAGAFRPLGRSFAAVGFLLAFAGTVFWAGLPDNGFQVALLLPALVSAAAFGLFPLPERLLSPLTLSSQPTGATAASPSPQERVQRLAGVLQEAGRAFEQAAPAQPLSVTHALGDSFAVVQQQVCQGCSLYRRCWETDFYRTVRTFQDIWQRIEEQGRINPRHVPDELTHYCIYPSAVLATLNSLQDLDALQRQWQRRLFESRALVAGYVQGVASILEQVAVELRPSTASAAPLLGVRHGVARLPGRGALISGDSVLAETILPGAFLLVLSDGMGAGAEAARESRHAVDLLRQLIGAGFSASLAVQTVNAALLLGATGDTFATIDLALIDLVRSRAEFIKTGAVSSLVRRSSDVTFVRGSAPPAGILQEVRVEPEIRPVGPGDILVMVTDGLWQRGDGDQERWLGECLRQIRSQDPQSIADAILARAVEVCDPRDDMTVLVACLDAAPGAPASSTGRSGATKVPRPALLARR